MSDKNFKVTQLTKRHLPYFKELIELFICEFDEKNERYPKDVYLKKLLEKPGFHTYVVTVESKVVGGLTAYELPGYYSEKSEIFIYDIAVKHEFQRKGLGKLLITTLKQYCMKNGIHLIFVEAHEEDKHAIQFYASTGGSAEKVVHFNYSINNE